MKWRERSTGKGRVRLIALDWSEEKEGRREEREAGRMADDENFGGKRDCGRRVA